MGGDKKTNLKSVISSKVNTISMTDSIKFMKFGDKKGKEMNMEILETSIDPMWLSKTDLATVDVSKENFPVPCSYNCVKCDYLDQNPKKHCKLCYNKRTDRRSCGISFNGFKYIYQYEKGFSKQIQLTPAKIILDDDQYDFTNKNNGRKVLSYYSEKTGVLTQSYNYSVTGVLNFYQDSYVNKDVTLNVFALNNFREKNTFNSKDDMNVNGINFLRMDIVKDQKDSVKCIVTLKYDGTNEVVKIDENVRITNSQWVWFHVKVIKTNLVFYLEDTKGKAIFTKTQALTNRQVAVNDNTSLLKNFGKYTKKLSYGSIFMVIIPNDNSTTMKLFKMIQKRFSLVKNYKKWDHQPCPVNCSVCSQIFPKNDAANNNVCLDCTDQHMNLVKGKCQMVTKSRIASKFSAISEFVKAGYVVDQFEKKLPEEKDIEKKNINASFFFRKNYISNESLLKSNHFFEIGDLKFRMKSRELSDYVSVDMDDVFSDERLFELPLNDSLSWFKIEIVLTQFHVTIQAYKIDAKGSVKLINTISTNINFKLNSLIGDFIRANTLDSLFSIHSIKYEINNNQSKRGAKKALPIRDIYGFFYPEVANFSKDIIKKSGSYLTINNERSSSYITPIIDEKRILIKGEKDLPLEMHIDDTNGIIYPQSRELITSKFHIHFNMRLSIASFDFKDLFNVIKVSNNKKATTNVGKHDNPLSNIVSIMLKDEKTVLIFLGDREQFIKNGKQIKPIEWKSKTSLLDKSVKFFINKTDKFIEISITINSIDNFSKKIEINANEISKLTNSGRAYLFDNTDEVNKKITAELLDFKISPISDINSEYSNSVNNLKYKFQKSCTDGDFENACTGCEPPPNGGAVFKTGYCLSNKDSQVLIDRNPQWVRNSSEAGVENFPVNFTKTVMGFSTSFSMRRFIIENEETVPLLRLYNDEKEIYRIQMDNYSFRVQNLIAGDKDLTRIQWPAGETENKNVHHLREYFFTVSVDLERKTDKIYVRSYTGNQKLNNSNEEYKTVINDYTMNHSKDLHFTPKNMKVYLGKSNRVEQTTVRPLDFYMHSLIIDPEANFLQNERVRSVKSCDKLCKVTCEKTDGICPFGMEVKDKIDLSVSSLGKDLDTVVSTIPMFRKLGHHDQGIKNNILVDKYLLNFDLIVDDLETYNTHHKTNQNLLFALNSKKILFIECT